MPADKKAGVTRTTVILTDRMVRMMEAEAKKKSMSFIAVLREIVGHYFGIEPRLWHLLPKQTRKGIKSGKRKG